MDVSLWNYKWEGWGGVGLDISEWGEVCLLGLDEVCLLSAISLIQGGVRYGY